MNSDAAIRFGLKRPDPPPPWKSFPFLKRYHGGIKSLVRKGENVPEYPTGDEEALLLEEAMAKKEEKDREIAKKKGFEKRRRRRDDSEGSEEVDMENKRVPKGVRFDPYAEGGWGNEYEKQVKCYLDNKTKIGDSAVVGV